MTDATHNPPQNLEAEENVIGAIILNENALDAVCEIVEPSDFYRSSHGDILATAIELAEASKPIDAVTLTDALQRKGILDQVGGKSRIHSLASLVPASRNAAHYAEIIKSNSSARQLIKAGQQITRLGWEKPGSTDELLAQAEEYLSAATGEVINSGFQPLTDILPELRLEIKASLEGNPIRGLLTNFKSLDDALTGLHPGQLILVAARPGSGKSALAQNIAENVVDRGLRVAFASLEMSKKEIAYRGIARESGVNTVAIRNGTTKPGDRELLLAADQKVRERWQSLLVNENPNVNPTTLRAQLRRLQRNPGIDLVIVDYIQLMSSGQRQENRQQEVSAISRSLKLLAKDLQLPVLALSQMSRNIDHRTDKRPQLSDLRESGALEQDADVVMFIHRDDDNTAGGTAEIIIAKNRMGQATSLNLAYVGRKCAFSEMARGDEP